MTRDLSLKYESQLQFLSQDMMEKLQFLSQDMMEKDDENYKINL